MSQEEVCGKYVTLYKFGINVSYKYKFGFLGSQKKSLGQICRGGHSLGFLVAFTLFKIGGTKRE